jgi:hypothetical protein
VRQAVDYEVAMNSEHGRVENRDCCKEGFAFNDRTSRITRTCYTDWKYSASSMVRNAEMISDACYHRLRKRGRKDLAVFRFQDIDR